MLEARTTAVKDPSQLRGAIIGFGSIGRRHFENLERLGVTNLTVVRRPGQCNSAFAPPPGPRVVASHEEAVAGGLDFAVICNPTRLHVETARHYMRAGVSLLVEKPLSDRPEDARQLVEESRQCEVLASMAYCMRYHPAYAAAREAVRSGKIGRVLYAKAWFESYLPAWHPWEDYRQSYAARKDLGGGALRTCDHEIDFLAWCLGTPEAVIGYSSRTGAIEMDADDHAVALIRYPGGAMASVELSFCRQDRSRGFEFIGDQGTLAYRWDEQQLRYAAGNDKEQAVLLDYRGRDINEMYTALMSDFVHALMDRKKRSALADLEAGCRAIEVCSQAELHTFPYHLTEAEAK
jgi:predicted dehydrogenase